MTVRIVHTGDAHIDSDVHSQINADTGLPRAWESHATALGSAVTRAVDEQADLFVHAGDGFKNGRPSQEAVQLFADTLRPLTRAGIPILLLDGNHERIMVPTAQRTATSTVARILKESGEVHVVEREPELVRISNGIQVASLPWLSKSTILSRLGLERVDPVEGDRKVVQHALDAMERMAGEADDGVPLILASHVTVDDVRLDSVAKGHKRGSEVDITSLFAEPILPRKAIEESPVSYAALSHIHARQRMGRKCFYAGSPDRLTMTDADDPKSANLVTIADDNTLERVDHIETAARLMHAIDLTAPDAETRLEGLTRGALVGITLEPGDSTPPESVRTMIADAGATLVTIKTVPKEHRRAAATVVAERTDPLNALRTWFDDRKPEGIDPDHAISLASSMMEAAR